MFGPVSSSGIQRLRWTAADQSTRWKLYNDWAANYETVGDTRLFDSPYAVRDCVLSCLQWLESEESRHEDTVDTGGSSAACSFWGNCKMDPPIAMLKCQGNMLHITVGAPIERIGMIILHPISIGGISAS